MGEKLEVGSLALTLIDLPPVMAGSVVELVERFTQGDIIHTPSGRHVALCNGWICAHALAPGKAGYADKALMPLRGVPDSELARPRRAGAAQ